MPAMEVHSSPGAGLSPVLCTTSQDLQAVGICSVRHRSLLSNVPGLGGMNLAVSGRCVLWVQVFVYS